jgi:hypothetical protein
MRFSEQKWLEIRTDIAQLASSYRVLRRHPGVGRDPSFDVH